MRIAQAYGAARGSAKDAKDAGDRTGTYVWPGGVALARHIAHSPELVSGKRVLELGAGTGIAGIVAARSGARRVALTDGSPAVLDTVTRRNAEANAPRGTVEVGRLRWDYDADLARWTAEPWDVVLAAEVGYERDTVGALITTLDRLLATQNPSIAILQMTPELVDNGRGLGYVKDAITKAGLEIVSVALSNQSDQDDDDGDDEGTARVVLTRKPASL